MNWLERHLETFVRPVLGHVPTIEGQPLFIQPDQMARIKNIWRAAKAQAKRDRKTLLLPGRDVWVFEILARRENFPTWFIPQCSRLAAINITIPYREKCLILDTGFLGSIPRILGIKNFTMVSHTERGLDTKQTFPHMKGSRTLALYLEYLPKYWKSGFTRDTFIGQEFSDPEEFARAAILTQQVYKDSSPRFSMNPYESPDQEVLMIPQSVIQKAKRRIKRQIKTGKQQHRVRTVDNIEYNYVIKHSPLTTLIFKTTKKEP